MLDRVIDAEWVATKLIKRCDVSVGTAWAGSISRSKFRPPSASQSPGSSPGSV